MGNNRGRLRPAGRKGVLYIFTRDVSVLSGFSLGASSIALLPVWAEAFTPKQLTLAALTCSRQGRAGIPEDDPRNPAVIADNVGDNVGDGRYGCRSV